MRGAIGRLILITWVCYCAGLTVSADARFPRGGSSASSGVTGRIVQNGFTPIDAYTWKNFIKSSGASNSISINGNNLATTLNSNLYPTGTLAANLGFSLAIPPDAYLGPMRMKWTGDLGNWFLGFSMTASSGGSFLSGSFFSGTDGDVTFTVNPVTTSATSNSIALGNQTFTVSSSLGLAPGQILTLAQTSSLTNYMISTVVSYSGTTLVVNVNSIFGSGTFTSWNIWSTPRETNSFFVGGATFTGLSDMILCRDQDFTTVTSDPFYHKFLSVLATENPQILRTMGSSLSGGTEEQSNPLWAYRRPMASMSYAYQFSFPSGAFAGDASGIDILSTGSYPDMPGSWTDKETFLFNIPANIFTVTIASPARLTLPKSVVVGEIMTFRTTGALPTGLVGSNPAGQSVLSVRDAGVRFYYALDAGSSNIRVSETPGGAAVDTSGTQSGVHSMGPSTARPITAVANNGSNIPRVTLPSTSGLTTGDIVQVNMGNIGAFSITVINSTDIDLTTSYPSGVAIPFSAGGQIWSTQTGLSPVDDPGVFGRAYLTTTTINVGSRGAKQIVGTNGMPLPPGNLGIAVAPFNGTGNNVCVYDAVSDMVMCGPGGLYTMDMPIETQVALANRLNKHLWYCFPVTVTDATVTSSINYIAQNLNSNLNLFVEHSNEKWNNAYTQYFYLVRTGVSNNYPYGGSGAAQQSLTASGLRNLQIMQTAMTAWTGNGRSATSLRRVLPLQAFGSTVLFQTTYMDGQDLPAPNNAFPNRPIDYADVGSWANYWNGVLINAQYGSGGTALEYAGLTSAAADYASGNPTLMASALSWVYGDFMGTNGSTSPTGVDADFSVYSQTHTGGANAGNAVAWEALFASYDAQRAGGGMAPVDMVAYEGSARVEPPSTAQCATIGISASCADISTMVTAFQYDALGAQMIFDGQTAFANPTSFPHYKNGSFLRVEGPGPWSLFPGGYFSRPFELYTGAVQYNQ